MRSLASGIRSYGFRKDLRTRDPAGGAGAIRFEGRLAVQAERICGRFAVEASARVLGFDAWVCVPLASLTAVRAARPGFPDASVVPARPRAGRNLPAAP